MQGSRLTAREIEVLTQICDGASSKEIAAALGIRFKTALTHRSNLLEKSGVHETVGLFRWAIEQGYVPPVHRLDAAAACVQPKKSARLTNSLALQAPKSHQCQ
jgi:DNA-binding CsgD family transcriptional regulator